MPGGQRNSVAAAVTAIIATYDETKLGEQTIHYNGQSIRTQKMQSGPHQSVCIYREDWPKVERAAEAVELPPANEHLKSKPIPPRNIKPGDDGISDRLRWQR